MLFSAFLDIVTGMSYIWQQNNWPHFHWDEGALREPLGTARHEQGLLLGRLESLGFQGQRYTELAALTDEIQKTSEIEGELLTTDAVRSSVARRLGIDIGALTPEQRRIEGLVDIVMDATRNYRIPLTEERLCAWQSSLFPTGRSGTFKISVGRWRTDSDGPMRVISGPMGREKIHYQAPPADVLDREMKGFLDWFNTEGQLDPLLHSALAHLWFVSIHPFDDGNGRIARALADMALCRSDRRAERFYSMSAEIRRQRSAYYAILEETQKGSLDITAWMLWYLDCFRNAVYQAGAALAVMRKQTIYREKLVLIRANKRQFLIIQQLLEGFEGKMTSSKWAQLAKCSQDSANRDIAALLEAGILHRGPAGGRSTSYELVELSD